MMQASKNLHSGTHMKVRPSWEDLYRYGSASFDPTFREKLSQKMYYIYKELLESGQEMSETFKKTITECMEKHEKDTDPDL